MIISLGGGKRAFSLWGAGGAGWRRENEIWGVGGGAVVRPSWAGSAICSEGLFSAVLSLKTGQNFKNTFISIPLEEGGL